MLRDHCISINKAKNVGNLKGTLQTKVMHCVRPRAGPEAVVHDTGIVLRNSVNQGGNL